MFKNIKRFLKEFNCNHHNCQKEWNDGQGWFIKSCSRCGRTIIYTENDLEYNPHKTKLP